jgi:hypothetical protein
MSGLEMLLCPLGMAAMGGIAWVLTRLPGRHTKRIARVARHSTCLPVGAKQTAETDRSASDTGAENEVAERV